MEIAGGIQFVCFFRKSKQSGFIKKSVFWEKEVAAGILTAYRSF